ncbi:3D domain-containing protein [Sporomusa sp.]|uniref:3D domain-containing protein n=1 Tax=Sporomusa sp. TaxID=2078658 RepID=UPI002BC26927|nr:3D domain-containing protein [Sporomusa sp.]HWR43870.1 3D domain-containing protein [Sporomusa sp.]
MKKALLAAIFTVALLFGISIPSVGSAAAPVAAVPVAAVPQEVPQEQAPLSVGIRGDKVRAVQKFLADGGFYAGEIDGVFGPVTAKAVKDFQQSASLQVTGTVDKETFTYLERLAGETSRYSRSLVMNASAYSAYDPGNGSYTYRGNLLRKGMAAVDPSVIPLGSRLYIKGYGYAIADDIGGAIKGQRIDLAFDSRRDALNFGVQKVTVYILD